MSRRAPLLPFEMGLALEQTAFADLAASPEAHGLHHAFVAERRALQVPAEISGVSFLPNLGTLGIWAVDDPAADLARLAGAFGGPAGQPQRP